MRAISLLAGLLILVTSRLASAEPARSADDFVDSLGVNTHLSFGDTAYGDFEGRVKPKLLGLGIRHVRDGLITGTGVDGAHPFYQRVRTLAKAGIRFSLITGMDTSFGSATDYGKVHDAYGWCDSAIDEFEGINEPDLQTIPGKPPGSWIAITHDAQKKLFETVRGDALLAGVKVAGPSITSLNGALDKAGDLSAYVDYGNGHPYPGGFCPACGTFYGQSVDYFAPFEAKVFASKPMVMTETGYTNAVKTAAGGHRPASEKASTRYTPRLFFEFFNRGIIRTYPYELLDERAEASETDVEQHFGIVRADGSEKPLYAAEKNLIALLSDKGEPFSPAPLELTISAPSSVHHTLLGKRDGSYFLVLWNEVESWDTGWRPGPPSTEDIALRKDLDPTPVTALVTVDAGWKGTVHALGDDGTFASVVIAGAPLNVSVRDAVSIVELRMPVASDAGIDAPADTGAGDSAPPADAQIIDDPPSDSGCSCVVVGPSTHSRPELGLLALLSGAFGLARLRRRELARRE